MVSNPNSLSFIDLFCGIGGFRIAAEYYGWKCVFSCDIDKEAQRAYQANFNETPSGDIHAVIADDIPDHDVLFAGFPCQPFSIIGQMNGMEDTRGTLFFEIARILECKRPKWFVLENVKQLVGHRNGTTFARMKEILQRLNYEVDYRVLNTLNFGLPQKRERVFIVGNNHNAEFLWPPHSINRKYLAEILEKRVPRKFYASPEIQHKRLSSHKSEFYPSIWHENKAGHISSYPFSCALRANASYNYLLVNGVRRLTPREALRLQGFPEWFKIACTDSETLKQAGNAVSVPVVRAVIAELIRAEERLIEDATTYKAETTHTATLSTEPLPV